MTIKSSFGAVNLDVNPGAHPSAAVLEPETPFRILLLGDFSGRAAQAAQSSTGWKPVEIDRDNFEEVLAGVGPGFSGMRFRELDDFHPDRIYQQNKLFQGAARGAAETGGACDFCRSGRRDPCMGAGANPACGDGAEAPPAEAQRPALPDAGAGRQSAGFHRGGRGTQERPRP